ncbi:GNAT family N-acetyltransferase [Altererythrobacter aquiaggeris]|uniref:GNAT family N-acetyltransferase n=1 Tax=Aestuarierythrobacter aquiaggeris TaxID=1898396 RepID=UPI0030188832
MAGRLSVKRLTASEIAEVLANSDLFDEPPVYECTAEFLQSSERFLWIAYRGATACGFLSASIYRHPDKPRELFIHEMGVAENARRTGVGTALIGAARQAARVANCANLWVLAETGDSRADAFYSSIGCGRRSDARMFTWEIRKS